MNKTTTNPIFSRGITENVLADMETYISTTHPHLDSDRIPYAEYLRNWEMAKSEGGLFKLFGDGNLIIRKRINYERSWREISNNSSYSDFHDLSRALMQSVRYFVQHICRAFGMNDTIVEYVDNGFPNYRTYLLNKIFTEFPAIEEVLTVIRILISNIDEWEMWYRNSICIDRYIGKNRAVFQLPNATRKFTISEEQKPIRALTSLYTYIKNNLNPESDSGLMRDLDQFKENVEAMRQYASMLSNQKIAKGNLCISIHPFDFMTMSDEANGWSSCMKWCENISDGGEFHSGTLEMMTSPCIIVAYLEGKDPIHPMGIDSITWNKKKWRELFIVDRNFISGIKGYPYCSAPLENAVFEMIGELAAKNWGVTVDTANIIRFEGESFSINEGKRHYLLTDFMYNDTEYNDFRLVPTSAWNDDDVDKDYFYGHGVYCLCCGKLREYDSEEEDHRENMLQCPTCAHEQRCPRCGNFFPEWMLKEAPDGKHYCPCCHEEIPHCIECGAFTPDHREAIVKVYYNYEWTQSRSRCYSKYIFFCEECYNKYVRMGFIDPYGRLIKVDEKILDKVIEATDTYLDGEDYWLQLEWVGEGTKPNFIKSEEED